MTLSLPKFAATAAVALLIAAPAFADGHGKPMSEAKAQALVQPFYDVLSNKGSVDLARAAFHPDWKSYYSNSGYKGLDATLTTVSGPLHQMIKDLTWEMVDVSVTTDNKIVVRGEATGTTVGGKLFGAPIGEGTFKIMSIDVHQVVDGKVKETHHIEDWSGAFRQLPVK